MREALRCDLRNGGNMKGCSVGGGLGADDREASHDVRHHNSVLQVLKEVMNPSPIDERYKDTYIYIYTYVWTHIYAECAYTCTCVEINI
jgi:hypothetical protein